MAKMYLDRVKEIVSVDAHHLEIENAILEMLDTTKAITFDGHFELLSGRHADTFFRFAAITQYPFFVSQISKAMVGWLNSNGIKKNIDVVLSPSSQGMFFAYDIARELNGSMRTRAVYTAIDREHGSPSRELVDGFEIKANERVLIVNDMTTTGSGIETLIGVAEGMKGNVVGICIFANRGVQEEKVKRMTERYPFHSIIDLNMPSWSARECKERCVANKRLIRASQLHHLPIYASDDAYEKYVRKLEVA